MEDIKERFASISNKDRFTRVNPDHPSDIFVGIDINGKYALKYRGNFLPQTNIKSAGGIIINHYANEIYNTLVFSLADDNNKG